MLIAATGHSPSESASCNTIQRGSAVVTKILGVVLALCGLFWTAAEAQSTIQLDQSDDEIIDHYSAYIGQSDLFNSHGERLRTPWQVIRQDRANYHSLGIRDEGDEGDDFFGVLQNREALEAMLSHGGIAIAAGRAIVQGNVSINVQVRASARGPYIRVEVY